MKSSTTIQTENVSSLVQVWVSGYCLCVQSVVQFRFIWVSDGNSYIYNFTGSSFRTHKSIALMMTHTHFDYLDWRELITFLTSLAFCAHELFSHFVLMSALRQAWRTTRVGALYGNLMANFVNCMLFKRYAWRGTFVSGPSTSTYNLQREKRTVTVRNFAAFKIENFFVCENWENMLSADSWLHLGVSRQFL